MISKVSFLIALILSVCWAVLFSFFNEMIYIHILAVVALLIFGISFLTRNQEE